MAIFEWNDLAEAALGISIPSARQHAAMAEMQPRHENAVSLSGRASVLLTPLRLSSHPQAWSDDGFWVSGRALSGFPVRPLPASVAGAPVSRASDRARVLLTWWTVAPNRLEP
jgi:hypothetical protein